MRIDLVRSANIIETSQTVVARAGSNEHYTPTQKRVMQMVARDGFVQHYTPLHIPINGLILYPAA